MGWYVDLIIRYGDGTKLSEDIFEAINHELFKYDCHKYSIGVLHIDEIAHNIKELMKWDDIDYRWMGINDNDVEVKSLPDDHKIKKSNDIIIRLYNSKYVCITSSRNGDDCGDANDIVVFFGQKKHISHAIDCISDYKFSPKFCDIRFIL